MKKTYIVPAERVKQITIKSSLLTGSGGVSTNSTLGDEYTETDVSYTKEEVPQSGEIWDNPW